MQDKLLKCPKTGRISLVKDCFNCEHLFQINIITKAVECEIDFKNHVTYPVDKNDAEGIAEL